MVLEDAVTDPPAGHISEEALDSYALGSVSERELAPVEEHLLFCPACQERLADTDTFIAALRRVLLNPGA